MPPRQPLRILSLIASATEIVCALGFRDRLVGRSHECDYPADVAGLERATRPRFDTEAASDEIDRRVRALAAEADPLDALGVYEIREDVLSKLRPTHIVTQSQCDVCAVSERDVVAAVGRLTGLDPEIVSLRPLGLSDVWEDIMRVASALGATEAGARLIASLQGRMEAIAAKARHLPPVRSVAFIEWADPLMSGGNWMPELVEMAGGRCLFGRPGIHSPALDFEDLAAADPETILISPCGFGLERTLEDAAALARRPGWSGLQAVRAGRVYAADGNQFFNRPGPRLAESLEILAEILHPEQFRFGHRESGWVRLGTGAN